ncbi:hypothetical protein [Pseudaminobacter sp. NGMCC 1.201702]|uniref:hypothetical protein n=1 Tax=Pseudaminobacter sp. NGMCC 1.201702 TaxID=3391825 RepID=UPI0039EF53B5
MKTPLVGAAVLATLMAPAVAGPRYDVKLERAVMAIVAQRIGDIRGAFSYERQPEFVILPESASNGSNAVEKSFQSSHRQMPMAEREVSRIIIF